MNTIQFIGIVFSGVITFIVIELIRRGRLKERYSLMWLAASAGMVIFSSWRSLMHFIAKILGIDYPPSFLFLMVAGFLVFLLLHFSTVISALSEKNSRLAQEIGILKTRLKNIEEKSYSQDYDTV
jgi:hypothetical protein